jgi:hypothetical protein
MAGVNATIPAKGNKVLCNFTCQLYTDTANVGGVFALYRDAVQLDLGSGGIPPVTGPTNSVGVSILYIDSPNAADHTYKMKWSPNSAATIYAQNIHLQIVELG